MACSFSCLLLFFTGTSVYIITVHCLTNVALNKPTRQSTTYLEKEKSQPSNAVDGNKSDWDVGACSHTDGMTEQVPWWQVDLQALYNITSITLTNRENCCANRLNDVFVDVYRYDPAEFILEEATTCSHYPGTVGSSVLLVCDKPVTGRFVRVYKKSSSSLTLCEVEVWGTNISIKGQPNIAWNKPAFQSTDASSDALAAKAVDGDIHQCSSTDNSDANPWLAVDLGSDYEVQAVTITNRDDCCCDTLQNFTLEILANDPKLENGETPDTCSKHEEALGCSESKTLFCDTPAIGRFFRMTKNAGHGALTVCEVKVTGVKRKLRGSAQLALHKTTRQSSTYKAISVSSKAVDGNRNTIYSQASCTETKPIQSSPHWWQVDLGELKRVTSVTVTNRGDCCCKNV